MLISFVRSGLANGEPADHRDDDNSNQVQHESFSRAISRVVSFSLPKTIALGGVATGNMKAKLQLIVAGTINSNGLTPEANAATAKIGNNRFAVAVLLVTSVRNVTTKQRRRDHQQDWKFR